MSGFLKSSGKRVPARVFKYPYNEVWVTWLARVLMNLAKAFGLVTSALLF